MMNGTLPFIIRLFFMSDLRPPARLGFSLLHLRPAPPAPVPLLPSFFFPPFEEEGGGDSAGGAGTRVGADVERAFTHHLPAVHAELRDGLCVQVAAERSLDCLRPHPFVLEVQNPEGE